VNGLALLSKSLLTVDSSAGDFVIEIFLDFWNDWDNSYKISGILSVKLFWLYFSECEGEFGLPLPSRWIVTIIIDTVLYI